MIASEKKGAKIIQEIISWKTVSLAIVGLVLVAVIFQNTRVGSYLKTVVDLGYGSNKERVEFIVRLLAPMNDKEAIIGKGLGDVTAQNFRTIDLTGYDVATGSAREIQLAKNRTLVDNQHLKTFVEMGLVGLLIYGWLYIRLFKHCWGRRKTVLKRKDRLILAWGAGFVAAFVVQGLFIDVWDVFPTNAYFWMIAALLSEA